MMQAQCRFCGVDTKKNKYLFDKANLEYVKMAMTIYPIVIHQSDPLPKYVCDVCELKICKEYKSRQSIIALNNQWINNLRLYEPQHGYLSLLDTIVDIKKFVVDHNHLEVKGILKQCVARVLSYDKKDLKQEELINNSSTTEDKVIHLNSKSSSMTKKEENNKKEISMQQLNQKKTPKSSNIRQYMKPLKGKVDLPMTTADAVTIASVASVAPVAVPTVSDDTTTTTTDNAIATTSKKITNLKKIFSKKGGCTFVTYGGTTIKIKTMPKIPPSSENGKPTDPDPDPLAQADDQHQTVETKPTEKTNTNLIRTCKICQYTCSSEEDLAIHQAKEHLELKLNRIFQKKTLPASFRRGRVMKVDDEQSLLRCLSCYRVYENNEEILEHWTNCKCDFYCLICNETYPESPKILREHVRCQHNVSHKQLRLLHENNNEEGTTEVTPVPLTLRRTIANAKCSTCCRVFVSKEARKQHMLTHQPNYVRKEKKPEDPSKTKKEKPATCKYCFRVFEHSRALNGHMRIHKPTINYGILTLPTNDKKNMVDKYMDIEVDPQIVVKNEALTEDNVDEIIKSQSSQKEQLPINTNVGMNPSPSSSSSLETQKGRIKVKSMHELMHNPPPPAKLEILAPPPAKIAKLEILGN